jgi:3'-phosphoadenosine 5'-phosphosulfate sulfotransferase (PAPS reductase)/FAD synthetase
MTTIVVSFSGGKDSTATALLALEAPDARPRLVFADTGNEHELTLEYVHDYIPRRLGIAVDTVRADFTARIANKRIYVAEKWPAKGVPTEFIERALRALVPTGVPFLDLCLWKGRFPSRMAQFCTQELKRYPLDAFMLERLLEGPVESWQGVRRDESRNRANVPDREATPEGWTIVRPIASWTADQVVRFVQAHDVALNPLYMQGMNRVGCMPCINVAKDELAEIARRYPQHIDRIREWEGIVSDATKRGWSTFFTDAVLEIPTGRQIDGGVDADGEPLGLVREMRQETDPELYARLNIDERVKWAMTSHGGKQFSLLKVGPSDGCSSAYGLCE